jgi:hypothetical protein
VEEEEEEEEEVVVVVVRLVVGEVHGNRKADRVLVNRVLLALGRYPLQWVNF